jgi:putative transposase
VLLGFKTELKLNNQQRMKIAKHCGVARHAWNWGLGLTKQILDHNKNNPDSKRRRCQDETGSKRNSNPVE